MSVYNRYPMVTQDGELPPKVMTHLDERYSKVSAQAPRRVLSAAEFGATPGVSGSQTDAIRAAMEAAVAADKQLHIPTGIYTMTGYLKIPVGVRVQMEPGTVLDFSTSTQPVYLRQDGTASTPISYPATIRKDDTTITLAGHGLRAGDWCMIRSSDVVDPDSTGTTQGELIQVRQSVGDQLTFLNQVCDTYTTAVTVTPVQMVRGAEITGGVIRGNRDPAGGKVGFRTQYTEGVRLNRVRFEDIDQAHVFLRDSVDGWVWDCAFVWAEAQTTGYGVSFGDTTRDSGCMRSTFHGVRHSLSTNNTIQTGIGGVTRRILFANNKVEYTTYALAGSQMGGDAIDTHTAAEDVWIIRNTVLNSSGSGINVECASAMIQGNTVRGSTDNGINVHNEARRPGYALVTGNRVDGSGTSGINVRHGTRGTTELYESLIVTDNHVTNSGEYGISAGYTKQDRGLILTGNTVSGSQMQSYRIRRQNGAIVHSNRGIGGTGGVVYENISNAVLGPDSFDAGAPISAWTGASLTNVTYSTFTPGAITADVVGGVGVNIGSSCAQISLGKTGHINAPTQLNNTAGPTVVQS